MEVEVTVFTTVYNGGKYLKDSIESILNQTFQKFEYIIIDDASTDGSLKLIQQYAAKDPRIRVIHNQENRGISYNRNQGVNLARGKYLAVMDADDLSMPTRLEKQHAFLESHPDYVVIGSKIALISPEGEPLTIFPFFQTHEEIDAAQLRGDFGAIMNISMIRLDAIRQAGGYRSDFPSAEDYDLFLRLAEKGIMGNLPEVLAKYRQHCNSICHVRPMDTGYYLERARREACARRGIPVPDKIQHRLAPSEKEECYLLWAWWALQGGYVSTARKYAFKSFLSNPFSKENIKALLCSLRGY